MEKDIAELNPNKLKKQGSYPDSDDAIYSPSYLCYAEAVQDYVPNGLFLSILIWNERKEKGKKKILQLSKLK